MENQQNQQEETEEIEILYDRRENQRIPLISAIGNQKTKVYHHLKPLSDERYFQLIAEIEEVQFYERRKVGEIYKPQYTLWKELFIEREGQQEKDSDALFTEAVQAIKALVYFQQSEAQFFDGVPFDEDKDLTVTFGAMYSGAFLELANNYKAEFDRKVDDFLDCKKSVRRFGLGFRKSGKYEAVYEFGLPYLVRAKGYAESENLTDVVPAWHIVKTTEDLFSFQIELLNGGNPMISR